MSNETSSLDEKKSVSDQVILQEVNKNEEQVDEVHEADYSEEQYKKILKKIVTSIPTSSFQLSDRWPRIGISCL